MPRGKPGPKAKQPWSRAKAAARVLSPDEQWAEDLCSRILADAHPYQAPAIEYQRFADGKPTTTFITLLVGRGGGKTTVLRARGVRKMARLRNAKIVYLAPTRPMAEELLWEPLKSSLEFYGVAGDFEFSESKLRCRCKRTGATYRLVGMDDKKEVNKLRGQPFDEVQPDEAVYYDQKLLAELLDRAVGPRLGQRHGTVCMASSPGSILAGPFYRFTYPGLTEEGEDGEKQPTHVPHADLERYPGWDGYVSFAWELKDVIEHPVVVADRERYEPIYNLYAEQLKVKKRNRWSDSNPIWLREYRGKWAADDTETVFRYRATLEDGRPWNQWDPFDGAKLEGIQALSVALPKLKARFPKFTDWRFVVFGDAGSKDPWACNVFAFAPQDEERNFWHVMPFERTRLYAKPFAELCIGPEAVAAVTNGRKVEAYSGIFGITGWPDGLGLDADQTTIDELKNVYGLPCVKADRTPHSKMGAVELVNGDLVDGRIKVIKNSPLEEQLMTLQWAEDVHGQLKENKAQANHSTDTLLGARKLVATLFDSGAVVPDSTANQTGYVDPQGLGDEVDGGRDEYAGLLADVDYGNSDW